MTDKEEFIRFLEKFNIPYHSKEKNYDEYYNVEDENEIVIIADDKTEYETITGYLSFYCRITFDKNNKFKEIGIWE